MYILKTVLIGDSFTGKTSISESLVNNSFDENPTNTIGVSFYYKEFKILNKKIKLQIWDTSGLDRFIPVTQVYIRDSSLILLVYDISNYTSFQNIKKWFDIINKESNNNHFIVLIGNKDDKSDNRQVSYQEGYQLSKELNSNVIFFETSAVSSKKTNQLFNDILTEIFSNQNIDNKLKIRVYSEDGEIKEKGCCNIL
jgi:small GTP-binding protein